MEQNYHPDKQKLFRLPWSTNESPLGWLEVTDIRNIHCEGCYRLNRNGHKSFQPLKDEVLFLKKWRNCDSITLAGGECLLHPDIIKLIRFIKNKGMKSVIITNGIALNVNLLKNLKEAGLTGVSFHIDSTQNRPEYKGKEEITEDDVNELRVKYARLVKSVKGLTTGFGITVDTDNLADVPRFVQWAINNIDVVNSISFKTYRGLPLSNDLQYFVGDKRIHINRDSLGYVVDSDERSKITVKSQDVYSSIKENFPSFNGHSYLGGTKDHESLKWILGSIIINKNKKIFGSFGKKAIEVIEAGHHLFFGTYVINTRHRFGNSILWLGLVDKAVRKAFFKWLKYILFNPARMFYPITTLNIGIVQAPDILPDGSINMCDGCPDLCVYEGKLINSCRLDECLNFGSLLHIHVKNEQTRNETSIE